jgi:hypothetical protein
MGEDKRHEIDRRRRMKTKEVIIQLQELDPEKECFIGLVNDDFQPDYRRIYEITYEKIDDVNAVIPVSWEENKP